MKGLTDRQQAILDFISQSIRERGYPPTIREIGKHMGIRSTNGVNDHLKALEKKGFLTRDDLKSRAMRPVHLDLESDWVRVPILGDVAAGQPLLATQAANAYEDSVKVDRFFLGTNQQVFALRVRGDSMIEDGIFDGDYVFVKKTPRADRGEIVVALIEGEATCKRFFREDDRIRFQPANSAMVPIYVHRDEFRETMILGTVIGIYRKY